MCWFPSVYNPSASVANVTPHKYLIRENIFSSAIIALWCACFLLIPFSQHSLFNVVPAPIISLLHLLYQGNFLHLLSIFFALMNCWALFPSHQHPLHQIRRCSDLPLWTCRTMLVLHHLPYAIVWLPSEPYSICFVSGYFFPRCSTSLLNSGHHFFFTHLACALLFPRWQSIYSAKLLLAVICKYQAGALSEKILMTTFRFSRKACKRRYFIKIFPYSLPLHFPR